MAIMKEVVEVVGHGTRGENGRCWVFLEGGAVCMVVLERGVEVI